MAPNATVVCTCHQAVVIIRQGKGMCSVCGRSYLVEATWSPKPAPAVAAKAANP